MQVRETTRLFKQDYSKNEMNFNKAKNKLIEATTVEPFLRHSTCTSLFVSVLVGSGVTGITLYLLGVQAVPFVLGGVSCMATCAGVKAATFFAQKKIEHDRLEAQHELQEIVMSNVGSK